MNTQENIEEGVPHSVSGKQLIKPMNQETSENLPKSVSMQLLNLMKQVVQSDVNPSTVKAACQCAAEIHKMLKLNIELRKNNL